MEQGNADSVHGRLMQDCGESAMDERNHSNKTKTAPPNEFSKLQVTVNFKPDTTTAAAVGGGGGGGGVPNGSVDDRGRESKRCLVCLLIAGVLIIAAAVSVIALLLRLHNRSSSSGAPMVSTKLGRIRGRVVATAQGQEVKEYLGIPFAKPPIGELRYADPLPLERLPQDPYEATDLRSSCLQPIDETYPGFLGSEMWNARNPLSEDCLYMNIWTPTTTTTTTVTATTSSTSSPSSTDKRAVMVWIYGGGFYSGTNALWVYDGKTLAAFGDVIVVSFNYRVGSFGYLSTGDGRIKGNFGMKDQVLALRWIRDNIGAFDGDPDRVTIFGESSGASSAGLHQMSNHSRDLFRRAIYQSGSPDSHWSFMSPRLARERSAEFLRRINCTQQDTVELLRCLRSPDATSILNLEWVDDRFMAFPWAPTVDGDFLTESPYQMLKKGNFQKKEALLGVNRDEGTYWIVYALSHFSKDNSSEQTFQRYLDGVDKIAWDVPAKDRQTVKDKYLQQGGRDGAANRDSLDKVCGDRSFTCPTEELAEVFSGSGIATYFYYLTYRSSVEVWPQWMGVIHGADVQWIFGMPLNKSRNYSGPEVRFSENIMSYWTNFAKTGNPNFGELPVWPRYHHDDKNFLEFRSPDSFVPFQTFREDFCDIWRRINRELNEKT